MQVLMNIFVTKLSFHNPSRKLGMLTLLHYQATKPMNNT